MSWYYNWKELLLLLPPPVGMWILGMGFIILSIGLGGAPENSFALYTGLNTLIFGLPAITYLLQNFHNSKWGNLLYLALLGDLFILETGRRFIYDEFSYCRSGYEPSFTDCFWEPGITGLIIFGTWFIGSNLYAIRKFRKHQQNLHH